MAIFIELYVVRLQIPVYDVSLVEILQCEQYLCRVYFCSILCKLPLSLKNLAQISTIDNK